MVKMKKLTAFLLAVSLLIITTFESTNFLVFAETIKIGVISGTDVRIRADASTNSQILDKVSNITTTVIGEKQGTDNSYLWYKVSFTSPGSDYAALGTKIEGYVREDLISVSTYTTSTSFEDSLKNFPESYHDYLRALHVKYPNWVFQADNVPLTFQEAVELEGQDRRKQVHSSSGVSWRSMGSGAYDWNSKSYVEENGGWFGASREVIQYYMDPRNFLNEDSVYIFLKQGYQNNVDYTDGVSKIISGTFMANPYSDPNDTAYNGSYLSVILAAGVSSKVSPYVLASTIRQEQGVNGSTLSNGYLYIEYALNCENCGNIFNDKYYPSVCPRCKLNRKELVKATVYNFFNWKASGSSTADVISNGAKFAFENGWTTRSASIIKGAQKYADGYISAQQDTYFYKNYNILFPDKIWHQYAQNVADSHSSAKNLKNIYSEQYDLPLIFRIPVYKNNSLPKSLTTLPEKNSNSNNYYFNKIEVDGLSPSFSRFKYEYALQVSGDTHIYVEVPETASIVSSDSFDLKKGDNTVVLTVKSQTGFTNDYTIDVNATSNCKLTVGTEKTPPTNPDNPDVDTPVTPPTPPAPVILKGDTNLDGKISLSDLSNIRLHLLGSLTLTGDSFTAADTNVDGKISLSDLSNVRLHLLGSLNLN